MFCLLFAALFFFLARFITVVFIVSICLVCDSSIADTCPSFPAVHFAFVCVLFVFVVCCCFSGKPKQKQGRGLVDCKLVQVPQ